MSYKLILRSKNSPFSGQFTDVNLGSVLSHANLDNNFINVKGNLVYTADTSNGELTMYKVNGDEIKVDLSGLIFSGDTFVSAATTNGNSLTLSRTDGVDIVVPIGVSYSNSTPTPTGIGGITAGSTFNNKSMQDMWDDLLYPYQPPVFNTFTRTSINNVYELGEQVIGGNQTFNWSTTNNTNIQVNTIKIVENHSGNILLNNSVNDSNEVLPTTTYTKLTTGSKLLYTISGLNTNNTQFNKSISRVWKARWYYGMSTNTSLTNGDITTNMNTSLTSGVVNNYINWVPTGVQYGYLIIPNYLPQPSDLKDSVAGCFGTNIPYINLGTTTFNNTFGVSQTYNIYRTTNAFNSSVNVWLCS